jgi:hypothetical protein
MILTRVRLAPWKLLRRILLSFALGLTVTFLPILLGLRFIDFESPNPVYTTALGQFLYWPLSALDLIGIDCVSADKVASPMACVGIALVIDMFVYSGLCFLVLTWPKRFKTEPPDMTRFATDCGAS